jgi:hypothetical protein
MDCDACGHELDDSVTYSPCKLQTVIDGEAVELTVCVACYEEMGGYEQ